MLIAGDIGGTKTIVGIYNHKNGPQRPLVKKIYINRQFSKFEHLINNFLKEITFDIKTACFGVAGPVVSGRAEMTNLSWQIDETYIKNLLNLSDIKVLNDLEATAYGLLFTESSEIIPLNNGQKKSNGTIAIIAPGTGLGEAFLTWNGNYYLAHASQGGHTSFSPTNTLEIKLLQFLIEKSPHVSFENVCSGKGIQNIYNFLKQSNKYIEPSWLTQLLKEHNNDTTPVIIQSALNKEKACEICSKTIDVFLSILGSETGNLALKTLSTGGIYLCGGIPNYVSPAIKNSRFLESFTKKGEMTKFVSNISVNLVVNTELALIGSANYGLNFLS